MKKLIAIFIFVMTALSSQAIFASDAVITYDQDDTKVTVSGKFAPSLKAKNVSLVITRKGTDLTAQDYSQSPSKDFLELAQNVTTDYQGNWSVVWYPSTVAHYTVKATVNTGSESAVSEFYYVEESRMQAINNALLSGTLQELNQIFTDKITMYVLEFTEVEIEALQDTSKLGSAIYYIRQDLESVNDIFEKLDFAYKLVIFNETNNGFEEITTEMKQYAQIDDLNLYNTATSAIKEETVKRIASKILTSGYSGYNKLFTDSLALAGVSKVEMDTYVGPYLELIDYEAYNNATASEKLIIYSAVAKNSYETVDLLKAAIDTALSGDNSGTNETPDTDNGGGGGGGGGKVLKPSEGTSTGLSNVEAAQPGAASFTDVGESHWAFVAISSLYDRKISQGYEDNTYKPDKTLTRAEAVTLLCRVFNVNPAEEVIGNFSDVNDNDWFASYINSAKEAGYISGDGTMFRPDENITRQDLCVMLYRFSGQGMSGTLLSYSDANDVADYAQAAVSAMSSNGIINGFEDLSFRPYEYATRAQTAQMLYKYLLKNEM